MVIIKLFIFQCTKTKNKCIIKEKRKREDNDDSNKLPIKLIEQEKMPNGIMDGFFSTVLKQTTYSETKAFF